MRIQDFKKRNSLSYKIKMWFYHLTFWDIISISKGMIIFIINFLMVVIGFLLLFIGPAFFLLK